MSTNQVIIYTNENGNVTVCCPTGEVPIEIVKQNDIPFGVECYIVDYTSLPWQYNDFFEAWEQSNGIVSINFEKSKNLTKDRLRQERISLFSVQDVLFQRAQESGQSTATIVAEKQRLRDLPTLTDNCTTLEQLRSLKASK